MKKVQKGFRKLFVRGAFLSSFLLALMLVVVKLYLPQEYEFIEPISLYGSILSSVIFIYGFILSPAMSEYKESERLVSDIESSLHNIEVDAQYLHGLQDAFSQKIFLEHLSELCHRFYSFIADDKESDYLASFSQMQDTLLVGEKAGIPANHAIRMKQELGNLKRAFLRIQDIKNKDSVPRLIHQLKNFVTFMVIATLFFLNIGNDTGVGLIYQIEELFMLFLISFLYIYLGFVINGFDNPFDKRRFTGYIDISFLRDFSQKYISHP